MPRTKTISDKQLAANRRNAEKSTGQKSEPGRQTVSLNAVNHGLTGQVALRPNEDIAAHQIFCSELIDEMAPANAVELNRAQAIAQDFSRLNRARAIENNMFAIGVTEDDPDPDHDPAMQLALASARTFINHANKFGLLTICGPRINRAIHKNRADLRLLQMERRQMAAERARSEKNPQSTVASAPIPINTLRPQTAPNGFVFANAFSAPSITVLPLKKAA